MPVKTRDPARLDLIRVFYRLQELRNVADETHDEFKQLWVQDSTKVTANKRALGAIVPTYLFMQVNVVFEDLIALLWQTRYSELGKIRVHFDEQLRILGELHDFKPSGFAEFRKVRHKVAHSVRQYVFWSQFEDYQAAVSGLASRIYRRAYGRKKKKTTS
jgi:hypothetical protein